MHNKVRTIERPCDMHANAATQRVSARTCCVCAMGVSLQDPFATQTRQCVWVEDAPIVSCTQRAEVLVNQSTPPTAQPRRGQHRQRRRSGGRNIARSDSGCSRSAIDDGACVELGRDSKLILCVNNIASRSTREPIHTHTRQDGPPDKLSQRLSPISMNGCTMSL